MGIQITGIRHAVPPQVQTAAELAPLIGQTEEWVLRQTGVARRHVAGDLRDPAILAAQAARPLIAEWGAPDLVLYAGAVPRQGVPDTSLFVARELGLSGIPCFSVNAVCLSFLMALKVAEGFLESGIYRRVLICVAELASRGRNFDVPEAAALMGDGAAAAMVERSADGHGPSGFEGFRLQTWPEGAELTGLRGGGTMLPPDDPQVTHADHRFHMDGEGLLRITLPHLRRFLKEFFAEHQLTPQDIDLVIPHQPSGPGLKLLGRWGFPEDRVINLIADYGNCVAASMPMALAIAQQTGRLQRGQRLLFLGTAAGLSIGAGLFRW
ncbi:MAG: ketoacyl-ACP synthase III [Planctomycetaceae bacterium]|nr:ketoacyl-ACP synthase III [Planctomycetaceae bacterium]